MSASLTSLAAPRRARNLAGLVVDYVKERVEANILKPGDKLPTESQLMLALGVSRTVVREAISRLQAGGVIETRHGIGSFVLSPRQEAFDIDMVPATTLRDVLSVLELRISLETECAGLAAQRATADDVARMQAALEGIEASHGMVDNGGTGPKQRTETTKASLDTPSSEDVDAGGARRRDRSVSADLQFHLSIAQATGNRYFVDILTQMGTALIPRTRIDSAGIAHADPKAYIALVNVEHKSILDAIRRGDADGARAAMRLHLSNSRERLRQASELNAAKSDPHAQGRPVPAVS
ncbi:GntR family transcriptional regulator [Robbsia andropogonis]|uniref:GntR family transcriptional regulator n=1 Tax=Robbsia andropogonis TaxID=28092 RepID=A0A0F5JWT9_9BURK|nr:FadR/GntR family transcriptional regulator [Robbsia andropogonis]KKB62175.1 GntR family transcriptional regulator [Robbsia andropogonis]MCP1119442.1 FadR family transcriptional regulator [Robbsia andropogonis]MCP1129425.1 FadR family transcriptional regulator [Robbsia andropogonis]